MSRPGLRVALGVVAGMLIGLLIGSGVAAIAGTALAPTLIAAIVAAGLLGGLTGLYLRLPMNTEVTDVDTGTWSTVRVDIAGLDESDVNEIQEDLART